jgi:3-deoxy-manno-octulosonate cytidylyltransferase (CMP-KDO synthetase)
MTALPTPRFVGPAFTGHGDLPPMLRPHQATQPAQTVIVIPARFASTRLPNKMLLRDTGKPLLQYTYEAACRARRAQAVVVATDHPEIALEVERFGGQAVMTSPDCASGTDRVAAAVQQMPAARIIVNVQGDEPEISPNAIDNLIALLEENPCAGMATLGTPLREPAQLANPACVKVVFDDSGRALYFSRSPIPYERDPVVAGLSTEPPKPFNQPPLFYQHLGIYAYRREELFRFTALAPSSLEQTEKLEQLRLLQAGGTIVVGVVAHAASGIDTPADYAAFVARRKAG